MELKDVIYKRRSVRKYEDGELSNDILEKIENYFSMVKPLDETINYKLKIIDAKNVKSAFKWLPNKFIAIYSEEKNDYLVNAGFILQQLDLYVQSIGLGSCWLGMAKIDFNIEENNMKFIIMLAIGYPLEKTYRDFKDFKRKEMEKISDIVDIRLEPARLAPSSVNSQPWYFIHENDLIHIYLKNNTVMAIPLHDFNRIDLGIALCHLYVSNEDTFRFEKKIGKKNYFGTIKL